MKMLEKLDELNLDPAAKLQVAALIQSLSDQAKKDAETIRSKDIKIELLTLELARLKRFRFAAKSEALSGNQLKLFEEIFDEDIAAIEAEIERIACETEQSDGAPVSQLKRPRADRQPLPAHLKRTSSSFGFKACAV